MEYPYTVNDIVSECKVSKQSIYTLIKKNSTFITENSTRKQRKIYYSQAAMDFFTNYYNSETTPETPPEAEKPTEKERSDSFRIEVLEREINALQAEIGTLRKQLEAKEAERLELLRQNGALILTLQQSQQEKLLLLPAPRQSFASKVKSIFKSKPQEKEKEKEKAKEQEKEKE